MPLENGRNVMLRLAIYTVLVGVKEALNDPIRQLTTADRTDLALDFICFTDNPELTSPTWRMVQIPTRLLPPDRLSRHPKTLPHKYLPNYDFSMYIDNTVAFKRLPQSADIGDLDGPTFRAFRHPWRTSAQDEADAIVYNAMDSAEVVAGQTNFYDTVHPLGRFQQLTAGTVLLRRHNHPILREFGELWWEQILLHSGRDQLSLDQCAAAAGCRVDYFPGDKLFNNLVIWPALREPNRIEGAFDADRYAWDHRHDAAARVAPKAHFLANGTPGTYAKVPAWFRYCCLRAGSSFGSWQPPRRGLADILDPLLRELPDGVSVLLVGTYIDDAGAQDLTEELNCAAVAIGMFYRFRPGVRTMVAQVSTEELTDPAPFRAAYGVSGFSLVVVIDVPVTQHRGIIAKFQPLLAPAGQLLLQFDDSLSTGAIEQMSADVGGSVTMDVYHGAHISRSAPIPSNVLVARMAYAPAEGADIGGRS